MPFSPWTTVSSTTANRSTEPRGVPAVPAQRKARREYENRVRTLVPPGP
ncbi:hypothetical protein [Streptomyces virginiae]